MARRDSHKQAEIDSRTPEFIAAESTKPFGWESYHWVRWATIAEVLHRLRVPGGAEVLDVGCGSGWTSLLLAQSRYEVTAVDLVPANVALTAQRASQWGLSISTHVADMEALELSQRFDFALIYDALHHSAQHRAALARVAAHLKPGGWLLVGETTWLHRFSPRARRHAGDTGWHEHGFTVRGLRSDLRAAGLGELRRFHQGTHPYEGASGFAWQLLRLLGAQFAAAPQAAIWLGGRKPG
jgi:2-polyprenyl-3-methyl-5-hydroxy-6-metoxy-1,4-benzoquinol methylase